MLERQLRPAQDFIENPLHHPQHHSREAGSCMGAEQLDGTDGGTKRLLCRTTRPAPLLL